MGRAIAVIAIALAIVAVVAIIAYVVRRSLREANEVGDLTLKQERHLRRLADDAALVMRGLGASYHIDETDVLSERSRETVDDWLRRYDTYYQKEINA